MATECRIDVLYEADLIQFPQFLLFMESMGLTPELLTAHTGWTARSADQIIAIGGMVDKKGGTMEAWAAIHPRLNGEGLALTWAARKLLRAVLTDQYRIQAVVNPNDPRAERWMRALGFRYEGHMRKYWNGQDRDLYALVRRP